MSHYNWKTDLPREKLVELVEGHRLVEAQLRAELAETKESLSLHEAAEAERPRSLLIQDLAESGLREESLAKANAWQAAELDRARPVLEAWHDVGQRDLEAWAEIGMTPIKASARAELARRAAIDPAEKSRRETGDW